MENFTKCEFFYGKPVNKKKFKKALEEEEDIIIDKQNLEEVEDILREAGYICADEGENMTGHNDLYQYYFEKCKN